MGKWNVAFDFAIIQRIRHRQPTEASIFFSCFHELSFPRSPLCVGGWVMWWHHDANASLSNRVHVNSAPRCFLRVLFKHKTQLSSFCELHARKQRVTCPHIEFPIDFNPWRLSAARLGLVDSRPDAHVFLKRNFPFLRCCSKCFLVIALLMSRATHHGRLFSDFHLQQTVLTHMLRIRFPWVRTENAVIGLMDVNLGRWIHNTGKAVAESTSSVVCC